MHRAAEGLIDLGDIRMREGLQLPIEREDICKDMRKLVITKGAAGKAICWWNTKLQEIKWSADFKSACAAISKESDLEQISAWCSLE